jgi:DnaJ-class molecular chaperone
MSNVGNHDWAKPRPKPTQPLADGHSWVRCGKCNATGLYVMEVRNGRPYSRTGTVCWSCDGGGWKIRKPRRVRCPACNILTHKTAAGGVEPHIFYGRVNPTDNHVQEVYCDGQQVHLASTQEKI